jgi:hypothetical protein
MPVKGADVVGKNIVAFGGGFLKHVNKVMIRAKDILDSEVTKNISLTDHPPEELAKMDYPYARRHGPQGIPIHDPYWIIHTRTGTLLSSKEGGTVEASMIGATLKASAYVGLNEAIAFYAADLIYGTSRMIPRDALTGSLVNVRDGIENLLHSNLRDFVFQFRGVG